MSELENALAQQAPPIKIEDPSRHEMPPLVIDGIPTPVEKMTQAQLRAFIPLMLKYSTGKNDDFSMQKDQKLTVIKDKFQIYENTMRQKSICL